MFNIGFSELVVLALLGLIILGPDQLPVMARKLARLINDLKRSTEEAMRPIDDFKNQAKDLAQKVREEAREEAEKIIEAPKTKSDDES
jgi:sec-independent protein translocase protein TatB